MTGTNYQKLLNVFTPELDELYVATQDILKAIHIYTARGEPLDNIGVLLDYERNINEIDESYRNSLIDMININTIAGTKESIIKLLTSYLRIDETDVIIQETTPNYLVIQLPAEFEIRDMDIKALIYRSIAAGVYVGVYYSGQYWDSVVWDDTESEWG